MSSKNGRTPPNAQDVADEASADRAIERNMQVYSDMAERTVLAALLRNSPSLPEDLDPHIFYRDQHQVLADHVLAMRANGHEPDMVSLVDDLLHHDKLAQAGGADYVSDMYELRPMSTETLRALRIVQRDFYRRRAEHARYELLQATANWKSAEEITRKLEECRYWDDLQAGAASEARPTRFRFLSVEELDAMPPSRPLLGDLLFEDTIAYLYGPSGRWKTFIALDWALSIACGIDWLGRTVKRGRVIYVAAEGSRGIRKRRRAWRVRHPEVRDYSMFRCVPQPVNLMDAEQVQAFIEDVKAQGEPPDLIVFDTLARSMAGGDENATKDANLVTDSLGRIKAAFDCCVLCVHHTGKDVGRGLRGSSAIFANADTVILVNGKEGEAKIEPGETIKLVSEKPKDSEPFQDIILTAEVAKYPVDDDGREWDSSLVIVGAGADAGRQSGKVQKLSMSCLTALVALSSATGMRATEWQRASGIKKGTFMTYTKPELITRGLAVEVGGVFQITAEGRSLLNGQPAGRLVPFRPNPA